MSRNLDKSAVLSRVEIEEIVHSATLAPSVLNVQPWLFVAHADGTVDVRRDTRRVLRQVDPNSRALTISCGAALFNLRLAVAMQGRLPEVQILPDPRDSGLLATVRAVEPAEPATWQHRLHGAIAERRTARVPFVEQPVAPESVLALEDAAAAEAVAFRVLTPYEASDVGRLVHDADLAQRANAELSAEIGRWTRRGPDATDGIPDAALGPASRDPAAMVRDFAMGRPVEHRQHADFESEPTLAIMLTADDHPAEWLRAGQALQRVWLEATAAGLAVSLLTQPLELSSLRWLARPLSSPARRSVDDPALHAPDGGSIRALWPQVLLRIGVAREGTPPTPRRPVADVLSFG